MVKKGFFLLLGCLANTVLFAATVSVFVSFSMPGRLLEETLKESSRLHIPAYLNGLHHNSMKDTALKVMELSQRIPDLNLAIDPTLFERFGIQQVPALVVAEEKKFDVIYGHLTLQEGLSWIAGHGETHFTLHDARRISSE
ncbi:TPA: type-F conjugative transfer system pilin assembly protein TrbC [Legionella bozemanae]|uniref:TrbC protein n=2 Tax=Legionellaceae TaxID=444 RepID=A8QYQ8_9GAMM|nr:MULTISPECIES: type-F conjugative transfer system pilin assembly protein TrbC [Legionellaceae]KTC70046.1 conjugative transfer protein [Legionella bozemanae]MCW8485155.1 type-F conjugative transfer system pilin assembly protein TrbC [Fluoribacter dumoffii]BAF92648.1 TrbC protein [Fluoribacter dumoffii Tex-KL]STP13930.1 conjugal transfer pilus assembly protein TrbC [Legionella bozemanae]